MPSIIIGLPPTLTILCESATDVAQSIVVPPLSMFTFPFRAYIKPSVTTVDSEAFTIEMSPFSL